MPRRFMHVEEIQFHKKLAEKWIYILMKIVQRSAKSFTLLTFWLIFSTGRNWVTSQTWTRGVFEIFVFVLKQIK